MNQALPDFALWLFAAIGMPFGMPIPGFFMSVICQKQTPDQISRAQERGRAKPSALIVIGYGCFVPDLTRLPSETLVA